MNPPLSDRQTSHRNLPLLLLKTREILMKYFRTVVTRHGLTEQQWRILRSLYDQEPQEPWQLGEACVISGPSIAGVLSRMEDLGLVSRERMDSDQRRVLVSMTPASRKLVKRILPLSLARYRELEALVGEDQLEQVMQALDRLNARLEPERQPAGREAGATAGNRGSARRPVRAMGASVPVSAERKQRQVNRAARQQATDRSAPGA